MAKISKKKIKEAEYLEIKLTKSLDRLVDEVLEENPGKLLDIQRGIRSSIDDLVTEVMHRTEVKVDPLEIRRLILKKL